MQQLDGVMWFDKKKYLILGYKDVTQNEFWIRGHIPGRPLMPAVIMVESAAQLLSFFVKQVYEEPGFIGFTSIDSAKFRSLVILQNSKRAENTAQASRGLSTGIGSLRHPSPEWQFDCS